MSKKLKNTLGAVVLGAIVSSPDTQAKTPISVDHYKQELAKIFAGQSNTPATHVGGILSTGENSLVAGQFEKGKHTSKITLATGGASDNIYGGIAVSGAKQNNLKGGKISGIVGITNGDIGANIEASSERGKSGKPTSKKQTLGRNWTEETPTEIHNFNETTHITQTQQIKGKSWNEIHVRGTKTLSDNVQTMAGVVHTTGSAVPKDYKKIAGEVGVKIKGEQGNLQITADTNKNINGRVNYNIDDNWSAYAGASYQPKQHEKNAYAGVSYSFGGGNHRGNKPSTPTLNNFGAHEEMKDYITDLHTKSVSDLSKLVEQQTRTIVTQKVTKNTTTKPTPPTTSETPKETKIPKNFPTLEEKPTFTPKPLVPHTWEEMLDLNNTSLNLTIPIGYTLDEEELAKNGGKLSVRNFYGAPRDEKDSELLLFTFDWDKKTNVLSNFLEEDRFVMHDGYLNLPLIDLNNKKVNYKIFLDNLGSLTTDFSKDFTIKTQDETTPIQPTPKPTEVRVPKNFPTLEEKPTFTPKPLVPHTWEEMLDLNNTPFKVTIPEGYTLDNETLENNGGKLHARSFYGESRNEKEAEDIYYNFNWNKETNTLSDFREDNWFSIYDGYVNIPLIDINGNKTNYKIFATDIGMHHPEKELINFTIKTQK